MQPTQHGEGHAARRRGRRAKRVEQTRVGRAVSRRLGSRDGCPRHQGQRCSALASEGRRVPQVEPGEGWGPHERSARQRVAAECR